MDEEQVWEGSPSQVINLGTYIICALTCWLVVPIFIAWWNWLEVRATRYVLTTERLKITRGVLTRRTEEMELYRIKDTAYVEPFLYRLFGVGIVEIASSDPSTPCVALVGIAGGERVREELRRYVEQSRRRQGIRGVELSGPTGQIWHG